MPFVLSCISAAAAAQTPQTQTLTINGTNVRAELARTPEERSAGYSHRPQPAPGTGILFVFSQPSEPCMWMRDVSFPLDVMFIDAAGKVVGAAIMQPRTTTLHCAPAAVLYALEVNAGWMHTNRVNIGDTVSGLPQIGDDSQRQTPDSK